MEIFWTLLSWIYYAIVFLVLLLLSPVVIPETWKLRYYAINLGGLIGATVLIAIYLLLIQIFTIELSTMLCIEIGMIWIRLIGWDLSDYRNVDRLIKTKNAVIIVNHQSLFDPFPFLPFWGRIALKIQLYGGSELRSFVLLRKAVSSQGHAFLERKCKRTAMNTLMSAERHFKKNQYNKILLFPEGTRNLAVVEREYKFLEFKKGAFRVAKSFGVPIIPVVIGPFYFIDQRRHHFRRGKSILSVLEPVYPEDMAIEEFAEKVKSLMQEEYLRLKDELLGSPDSFNSMQSNHIQLRKKS